MSAAPLTRRDALRLGGAAAASVLLAPRARAAAWKPIPIGTQLWCVRKELADDIPGTLKAVGALGYQAVEIENAFGKSGAEWKRPAPTAGARTPRSPLRARPGGRRSRRAGASSSSGTRNGRDHDAPRGPTRRG